ncbi:alpha-hydroxy acid oxidase [Caballeronia sp. dw_19]|uniref:alpha-hydroxy acid oxidase n=1 Tax=Caballeronia sp. dw_19 TaxID=2719791 RepID=UPI001BD62460|nr:alpha-hydroxy acid oxidase [Caballeronia sp. dw_19]
MRRRRPPAASLQRYLNVSDIRVGAKKRLPRAIFEFIDRGTEDDIAVAHNRQAFDQLKLRHRAFVDVSERTFATTLFEAPLAMPVAIAPTGFAGLCWYDGEIELARAAAGANIPFTLATGSIASIERVADAVGGLAGARLWFQLNVWHQRALSHQLVERAARTGFETLIVTVDTPVSANREYNVRNGFQQPFAASPRFVLDLLGHPRWCAGVLLPYLLRAGMPRNAHHPAANDANDANGLGSPVDREAAMRCDSLGWDDLKTIRRLWHGPLLIKGVNRRDDAIRAIACGVDGVVVSNHGGRNMDSAAAAIDLLPEIVDAVGTRATVIVDSGVRRGSDIVKALALGAQLVLIGRAALYGTALGGSDGATRVLEILRRELDRTMAYTGCRNVSDIDTDILYRNVNNT